MYDFVSVSSLSSLSQTLAMAEKSHAGKFKKALQQVEEEDA